MNAGPRLRDIHLPPEPGWWPPTAATTLVAIVALALLAIAAAWLWRRMARWLKARALARFFDREVAHADAGPQRLQRASACLRRAVSRAHPGEVATTGQAWLALLDGADPTQPFSTGPGRLLAEGPFRDDVGTEEAQAAIALARARFIQLGGDGNA